MDHQAIAVFCNPLIVEEVDILTNFIMAVNTFGLQSPYIIWVPHTTLPEERSDDIKKSSKLQEILNDMIDIGIDSVLGGEPSGDRLALAITARVKHAEAMSRATSKMMDEMHAKKLYLDYLKECNETMVWDYARTKIAPSIPSVDPTLPQGVPAEISNYKVGKQLGKGHFGSVYKLHHMLHQGEDDEGQGKVVKLVPKDGVTDFSALKMMKRTIDLMGILRAPENYHANIVRLHSVFHSPTHIMFIMEDGGPENLHQRLCYRTHTDERKKRPMPAFIVESLIMQTFSAMHHLHHFMSMCHRDIKPENMLIKEDSVGPTNVVLKLADFDMACECPRGMKCKTACGTMPFTAPEVLSEKEYDGRRCDMWSVGILLLELLCGVGIVERSLMNGGQSLHGQDHTSRSQPTKELARKIYEGFSNAACASQILEQFILEELALYRSMISPVLTGLLTIAVEERWDSAMVTRYMETSWSQFF